MERNDRELIEQMLRNDMRLKRLYDEHLRLEQKLERFSSRTFLTAAEQREERELKKRKLIGVDNMMELMSENQPQQAA